MMPEFEEIYKKAHQLYTNDKDLLQALKLFEKVIAISPDNHEFKQYAIAYKHNIEIELRDEFNSEGFNQNVNDLGFTQSMQESVDEDFYLLATNEVSGEQRREPLWAKVMALAEGDQNKAKYQYIKIRAVQLIGEEREAAIGEFGLKYMPVSEFCNLNYLLESKVVEMIQDGSYIGQKKDGQWFVRRSEVVGGQITDIKKHSLYSGACEGDAPACRDDVGFQWWQIWAWLGLTLGNIYTLGVLGKQIEMAILLIIINSVLMVLILKYNKHAFLLATILSLNPLLWIINGVYLRNRWNHPKVNNRNG